VSLRHFLPGALRPTNTVLNLRVAFGRAWVLVPNWFYDCVLLYTLCCVSVS